MPKATEHDKKIHSRFGGALTSQREAVGFAKQGDAADASTALAREAADIFESFSQQWLSRLESDQTGERIDAANRRKLRTLSYLLGWSGSEFEYHVGVPVGTVPKLKDKVETSSTVRHEGDKEARIRLPLFNSLAEGITGFEKNAEPNAYRRIMLHGLPKDASRNRLFFVKVAETDLYDKTLRYPVPAGALLLIEATQSSKSARLVVAYIPERKLGVVMQARKELGDIVLCSYQKGGAAFWASQYPKMHVGGVVRRVCYEP